MTLDEFRATGRDCDNLTEALHESAMFEDTAPGRGRIYFGDLWIQRKPADGWPNGAAGEWFLECGSGEWFDDDLRRLEVLLYEYAVEEGYFKEEP